MKILDENLLAEAGDDNEAPGRLIMDDKEFLESLAKKAEEIESEPEKSK